MILGLQHHHYCVTCVVTTYAAVAVRCPFPIPLDSQSVTVVTKKRHRCILLRTCTGVIAQGCGCLLWKCVKMCCLPVGWAGWLDAWKAVTLLAYRQNSSSAPALLATSLPLPPSQPAYFMAQSINWKEYTRLFMYILKLVPSSCVVLK